MLSATGIPPVTETLAVSPLQLGSRKAKDLGFGVLYMILLISTIIILVSTGSTSGGVLRNLLRECTDPGTTAGYLRAGLLGATEEENFIADLIHASPYLLSSLLLSCGVGAAWMWLLRSCAKPVVYATLIWNGAALIALGVYLSSSLHSSSECTLSSGDCTSAMYPYLLCGLGLLYFAWLFCARRRIDQTAALLEQATLVVGAHPGLFAISAVLLVIKVLVLALALSTIAFVFGATVSYTVLAPGQCEIEVEISTLHKVMLFAVSLFGYWSIELWLAVRHYVTSCVTGIWYYERASLAAQEGSLSEKHYTRAPIRSALGIALTSGFGTIAFGSLFITIFETLKRIARKQQRQNGLIGMLVASCILCFLSYIEFLTRFALVYSALTGESFCTSGKTFLAHCERHGFLRVIVVDYIAGMTLSFGSFVLALLVSAATTLLVDERVLDDDSHDQTRKAVLGTIATFAALVAFVVLHFIASLLLNVVDAAYACIILDLDNYSRVGSFHRPAIATAVVMKVKPECVVLQPSGSAAYAVPSVTPQGQPVAHAA